MYNINNKNTKDMNYNIQDSKAIIVRNKRIIKQLVVSEITHIIYDSYLCDIFTLTDKFTMSRLLKTFEDEPVFDNFIRINNSTLINATHINYIDRIKKAVILKSNIELPFSTRRWKYIKSRLQNV
ncbi:MAG: LytTR family transcriptional regulator [Prevotellaceae bacterium]|jgi:DNA-binding LytR/AlgR family response regulator|nr:LytTR family transcriptional regulator [Prevotellaceae bacterium]